MLTAENIQMHFGGSPCSASGSPSSADGSIASSMCTTLYNCTRVNQCEEDMSLRHPRSSVFAKMLSLQRMQNIKSHFLKFGDGEKLQEAVSQPKKSIINKRCIISPRTANKLVHNTRSTIWRRRKSCRTTHGTMDHKDCSLLDYASIENFCLEEDSQNSSEEEGGNMSSEEVQAETEVADCSTVKWIRTTHRGSIFVNNCESVLL